MTDENGDGKAVLEIQGGILDGHKHVPRRQVRHGKGFDGGDGLSFLLPEDQGLEVLSISEDLLDAGCRTIARNPDPVQGLPFPSGEFPSVPGLRFLQLPQGLLPGLINVGGQVAFLERIPQFHP